MIKKIYKINWLLFLILILIPPIILGSISVGFISIWRQLELKISTNSSVYIISKSKVLYINISILLVSLILLLIIFFCFCHQLVSNTFTYKQIKIDTNTIHNQLIKKIEHKLLTVKNFKKWLFKNNIEYQIIDKKSNKNN